MIKTIFREVIITILLCVAILLLLSVLFYEYNPLTKTVPSKIAYQVPENIAGDLEEVVTQLQITNVVYTIEGSDLNSYEKSNSYVSGKANPFASSTQVNTVDNTQVNENTQIIENINKNPDATGTFFNQTGTK